LTDIVPNRYNDVVKVIAVIADIVDSRRIERRQEFQRQLQACLSDLNETSSALLSPYTITLGDEFQAVYKAGSRVVEDLLFISRSLFPVSLRIALGVDDIATDINTKEAIGMDGPAFHVARDGLNNVKEEKITIVQLYGRYKQRQKLLNSGLYYAYSVMSDWKEHTLSIFYGVFRNQPVKDIARIVGISERGVYKTIKTHNLVALARYFQTVSDEIAAMGEG